MTSKQLTARSKGGKNRAVKYSREQLSAWAKKGGRPRNLTLSEINQLKKLLLTIDLNISRSALKNIWEEIKKEKGGKVN